MPDKKPVLLPGQIIEGIEGRIYSLRGQRVMLSHDLAALYQVETRTLMQAVQRNADRFPGDFSFKLTNQEVVNLKSQIVISSWGGSRKAPHAFTEQGVAMLSSVLRSSRAVGGKYRNHARICQTAQYARIQQGSGAETR